MRLCLLLGRVSLRLLRQIVAYDSRLYPFTGRVSKRVLESRALIFRAPTEYFEEVRSTFCFAPSFLSLVSCLLCFSCIPSRSVSYEFVVSLSSSYLSLGAFANSSLPTLIPWPVLLDPPIDFCHQLSSHCQDVAMKAEIRRWQTSFSSIQKGGKSLATLTEASFLRTP